MPFKEEVYVRIAAPGALQRRGLRNFCCVPGRFFLEELLLPFKEEVYVRIAAPGALQRRGLRKDRCSRDVFSWRSSWCPSKKRST